MRNIARFSHSPIPADPHAIITLTGLGSDSDPTSSFAKFIRDQSVNAWSFERKGDVRLAEPGALSVYRGRLMTEMDHLLQSESITQIHLLANSFGAFAVLHALSKGQLPGLASLTLLAPLIDPYPIISGLPAGLHRENAILVPVEAGNRFIPIHRQNLADLDEWRPVPTNVPTLAIIGSKDEVENPANLSRIEWNPTEFMTVPEMTHGQTTGHEGVRTRVKNFLRRVMGRTEMERAA